MRFSVRQALAMVMCGASFLVSCGPSASEDADWLLRVGGQDVTLSEYRDAFSVAAVGYSHNDLVGAKGAARLHQRVLEDLIERALLSEVAEARAISIPDVRIENGVSALKAAYPDAVFSELLEEAAVPESVWEGEARRRIRSDLEVEALLADLPALTPEQIASGLPRFAEENGVTVAAIEAAPELRQALVDWCRNRERGRKYATLLESARQTIRIGMNSAPFARSYPKAARAMAELGWQPSGATATTSEQTSGETS